MNRQEPSRIAPLRRKRTTGVKSRPTSPEDKSTSPESKSRTTTSAEMECRRSRVPVGWNRSQRNKRRSLSLSKTTSNLTSLKDFLVVREEESLRENSLSGPYLQFPQSPTTSTTSCYAQLLQKGLDKSIPTIYISWEYVCLLNVYLMSL